MSLQHVIKLFEDGNVCVTGLRGRGKDLLISNVVLRRKLPYVCNVDYGGNYIAFNPNDFNCGCNSYKNFIENDVKYYHYPFGDNVDCYVSDAGIYFPSQFCNELNKYYPYMATFQALSRHFGCNFHINVQNLNRCWDKIREQSDTYIMTMGCKVLFGIVFQRIRIYEKYESCVNRMPPFRVTTPLLSSPQTRINIKLQKQMYESTHGEIKSMFLIYRNKSNYNSRFFNDMLKNGKVVV